MRKKIRRKYKPSYGTDIHDMTMVLDDPYNLNKKGLKKRRSWVRRGLI
jgi:hypothetical protein